jgi:hypothetical protein
VGGRDHGWVEDWEGWMDGWMERKTQMKEKKKNIPRSSSWLETVLKNE